MATYTSNYGWTKPSGSDNVDISVLNDNLDDQDSTIHDAFLNMAPPFSESSTYAVDDIVLYGTGLYKCHTAVVTPGSWTGSTNWQVYKLSEGGSGGGTTNYNQLTNKPSINSVTLSGNKTSADLGLQDAIQIDTMPTASATYDGKIVQYVGTTTASYTHGYYYECINNGGTYSWTQLNVQPSSGGGTSDYADLTNKPQINGVTLTGNKSTSDLGINASAVGLGNVPNVSTNDQEPTFSEASTRNNIASGEKLSVIFGKIQKFFNDLKTVAFTGSFSDLSNKPENANTFQGTIAEWNQLSTAEKKAYDHASIPDSIDGGVTFPANKVVMTGGGNVEDAIDDKVTVNGTTCNMAIIPRVSVTFSSGAGSIDLSSHIPTGYRGSIGYAQANDTGSVAITGCAPVANTTGTYTVKAISGGSAFTGSAEINFIIALLPTA